MMILPQQDGVCALAFYDDLIYWQLDELFVETCCAAAVKAKREQVLMDMEDTAAKLQRDAELVFRDDRVGGMQEKLFYTMEDEDSSLLANVVSKTSLAFVIISTVVMCLETVGSLQGAELQKFLIFKVLNGLKKQILGQKYQKLYLEGCFEEKCLFCTPTNFLPQLFDIFTHLPYLRHFATLAGGGRDGEEDGQHCARHP